MKISIAVLTLFVLFVSTNAQSYDLRGCWTCPGGYTHWFNAGLPSAPGGDRCACVKSPTTTSAPTTKTPTNPPSSYDTRGCWTCPGGYTHWFNAGLPSAPAGDRCACVAAASPPTTTKAPTKAPLSYDTRGCWTCPAGYSHWFAMGLPEPSDKCACVRQSSSIVTTSPSSQSMTTEQYLSQLISVMTPTASSTGSISFASDVTPYAPWKSAPLDLVKRLLKTLYTTTKYRNIMVYYTDTTIAAAAAEVGFTILAIIGLTTDPSANAATIARSVNAAKQYPKTILGLSCGNEMGANYGTTGATAFIINQCLNEVRSSGVKQPVGVIDIYNSWYQGGSGWSSVANNADFIGCNEYPWYANQYSPVPFICATPNTAAQNTLRAINSLKGMYRNKHVILTEFGWPGADNGNIRGTPNIFNGAVCADANNQNQKVAVQNTINLFRSNGIPCNTFSAFRESWKAIGTTQIESMWGICSGSANDNYNCYNAPV